MSKIKKHDNWLVADCETDAFDGQAVRPFLWALITRDGERFMTYDTAELCDYLREFDGVAYAHNGGKFDWLMPGVVDQLDKGEVMLINSRLAKATIGKCEVRDSLLIIPSALSASGEKLSFDYSKFNRKNLKMREKYKAEIERYIWGDVEALYNLVARFRAEHGDALTMPGAAMKAWEKMGGSKRRYGIYHDAFFREFYYGGRCEALEYGAPLEGVFESYDINSSYPAAMCQVHPLGVEYKSSTDYRNCPGGSFWRVQARSWGAFPMRDKDGLYFPRDGVLREYCVTGWEIAAALETGTADIVSGLGHIPLYTESLAPYVEHYHKEKERCEREGDIIGRILSKFFLNMLYGKYSANPESYKNYLIVEPGERISGYTLDVEGDGYDILSKPAENAQYFDVALGGSITGYARAQLWRGMCSSKRVVYVDTDNVKSEKFGLKTGEALGDWKNEGKIINLHIAGKKLYAGQSMETVAKLKKIKEGKYIPTEKEASKLIDNEWKTAHKGFSKLDTEVADIIKAAKGEIVEIQRSAPSINISGAQVFIKRKMRKTQKRVDKARIRE